MFLTAIAVSVTVLAGFVLAIAVPELARQVIDHRRRARILSLFFEDSSEGFENNGSLGPDLIELLESKSHLQLPRVIVAFVSSNCKTCSACVETLSNLIYRGVVERDAIFFVVAPGRSHVIAGFTSTLPAKHHLDSEGELAATCQVAHAPHVFIANPADGYRVIGQSHRPDEEWIISLIATHRAQLTAPSANEKVQAPPRHGEAHIPVGLNGSHI